MLAIGDRDSPLARGPRRNGSRTISSRLGRVRAIPILIGESVQVRTVAPKLGQQNAEIFRHLGLTDAEMHRLRERGVL
jgi:crotonobetainyl-CoA:carnitine CoA-transferase CaiB-like acyl-CoA transferase